MNVLLPHALLLKGPSTLCCALSVGAEFSLVEQICVTSIPFTLFVLDTEIPA